MFERFTDRARRVVINAQDIARRDGCQQILPQHLYLGILALDGGIAKQVLDNRGITAKDIQVPATPGQEAVGHLPFTPLAKKSLEFSLREALNLGHTYIGTEHLLLGIIRSEPYPSIPLSLEQARRDVIEILGGQDIDYGPDQVLLAEEKKIRLEIAALRRQLSGIQNARRVLRGD